MNRRRAPPHERRSGTDRRQADKGPPTTRERRVSVEPRKPDVREIEMTPSEWAALTGGQPAPDPAGAEAPPKVRTGKA